MLSDLQALLAGIYDVDLPHDVAEFLMTDRSVLPQALQATATARRYTTKPWPSCGASTG